MNADLQTLYDLFGDSAEADSIPPMMLEERQLETIVEAWNDLKEYGTQCITPPPPPPLLFAYIHTYIHTLRKGCEPGEGPATDGCYE